MPVYNPPTYREQYTKIVGFDAATCDYVCDGVADQVQWNQAIAAVAALGGGTVAGQRGLYDIAATINGSSLVDVHGSGDDTILKASFAGPVFTGNNINHFKISNLQIDGNSVGTYGAYLDTCSYWTIQDCYIHGFLVDGVWTNLNYAGVIFNNIITGCLGHGICCSFNDFATKISTNYFEDCGISIYTSYGTLGLITNNVSFNAITRHIHVEHVTVYKVCENSTSDSGSADGVLFEFVDAAVFADNSIIFTNPYAAPATYALRCVSSSAFIIKGNSIGMYPTTDGIQLYVTYNFMVIANVIYMQYAGGG